MLKVRPPGRLVLPILVFLHLVLGTVYSVATPLWEGFDEVGHEAYVSYLARYRSLPPPGATLVQVNDESHQPPLYYALAAIATAWADRSDWQEPQWNQSGLSLEGGLNNVLHVDDEGFPYLGAVLGARAARWFSVLLSALVVVLVYRGARAFFPDDVEVATAAAGVAAFAPTWVFIGSIITNDVLVVLLASLLLLLLARAFSGGPVPAALIGLTAGLALLTKSSGAFLLPVAAVGVGVASWWQGRWKALWRKESICVGTAVVISGAWYLRNVLLRSSLFPGQPVPSVPTEGAASAFTGSLPLLGRLPSYSFRTFWASFGTGVVEAEPAVYGYFLLLGVASIAGLALFVFRHRRQPRYLVLLFGLGVFVLSSWVQPLARFLATRDAYLVHGRFLLPGIAAAAIIIAVGFVNLWPGRLRRPAVAGLLVCSFAVAGMIPFRTIIPAYVPPVLEVGIDPSQAPNPLHANFGNQIVLLGYETEAKVVRPGDEVAVTLYWQALAALDKNYVVGLHIIGPDIESYGQRDVHPGQGKAPTRLWRPGQVMKDTYRLRVSSKLPPGLAPAMARFSVGLYVAPGSEQLPFLDKGGTERGRQVYFGRLKLVSETSVGDSPQVQPAQVRTARFGDSIKLLGYDLEGSLRPGGVLSVKLYWRAIRAPDADYTVFVQLFKPGSRSTPWSQDDMQPRHDGYPTSMWSAGETVQDEHWLSLPPDAPPGEYLLLAGLYRTADREPLLVQGTGEPSTVLDKVMVELR